MDVSTLGLWFLTSMCMFTLPFVSYFGTQYTLREYYPNLETDNYVMSVLIPVFAAIFTVWIIISLYAYKAFREEEISSRKRKASESKNN